MLHSKMSRGAAKNQRVRFKVVLNVSYCVLILPQENFPKVTVVIQVGPSPPSCTFNVGRSGRGGNKGKGISSSKREWRC
jgi:hypothetical protein